MLSNVHPSAPRKPVRNVPAKIRTPLAALTDIATKERPPNEVSTPVAPDWLKRTPEGLVDFKTTSMDTTAVLARLSGHPLPPVLPINVDSLLKLPQVHSVTVVPAIRSERRIVHILNMHYVPRAGGFDWERDVPDSLKDDCNRVYETLQSEVEAVQNELETLLREMIQRHHIRAIYAEGLSPEYRTFLRSLKKGTQDPKVPGREQFELVYGALARLFLKGELTEIVPAEDLICLMRAYPVKADGSYRIVDSEAHEKREDAMLECMMAAKQKDAVIVLGGGHDLTDNIQRLGKPCQYIRVETKRYWEFSQKLSTPGLSADFLISGPKPLKPN